MTAFLSKEGQTAVELQDSLMERAGKAAEMAVHNRETATFNTLVNRIPDSSRNDIEEATYDVVERAVGGAYSASITSTRLMALRVSYPVQYPWRSS